MSQTLKRVKIPAPILVVFGLIVAAAVFLLLFDFKAYAERRASAALGRPVTIAVLHVRIFPLAVVLEDLNVADRALDAPPDNKPAFMQAQHVDAVIAFWPLLTGRMVLPHLDVERALARLARDADGRLNWDAAPARAHPPRALRLPEIDDLTLRDVKMLYRDAAHHTDLSLDLETGTTGKGGAPTLIVKGVGTYEDQPSRINATGGSILTLGDAAHPYPIDGTLTSGPTTITVKGTVTDPVSITGLDVRLAVKGDDAADLYRVVGVALPPTPPYVINSHLDHDGPRWIFKDLTWTMGKSDMAGELTWDVAQSLPRLTGRLHGMAIALDDFGGVIGAAPGDAHTPETERRAAAGRERAKRVTPGPEQSVAAEFVIPDAEIDLAKLNSMNADVRLEAERIVDAHFPLDSVKVEVRLENGVLRLKPLEFGAAGGTLSILVTVNGRVTPVKTDVTATMKGIPLERLTGRVGGAKTSFGALGGHAEFSGTGLTMHRILRSASGQAGFAVAGGQVSQLLVELMGLDLARSLGLLLTGDKPTPVRCIVGDFALDSGKLTARAFVADTNNTLFRGDGSIDVGREIFDMRVHAKPKHITPASLRSKLLLTGTFAHPSFGPDAKAVALRGGAAVALGAVLTPLASLLALADIGGGKNADCEALLQEAAK